MTVKPQRAAPTSWPARTPTPDPLLFMDEVTLSRQDHERGCRNEPPWPNLSISHRLVHDLQALQERRRKAHRRLHPIERGDPA